MLQIILIIFAALILLNMPQKYEPMITCADHLVTDIQDECRYPQQKIVPVDGHLVCVCFEMPDNNERAFEYDSPAH